MHEIFNPAIEITMFDLMTSTRDILPNINSLEAERERAMMTFTSNLSSHRIVCRSFSTQQNGRKYCRCILNTIRNGNRNNLKGFSSFLLFE